MEHLIFNEIINKMADQIEMSTAEGLVPANVFRQTINFFGRTVPMKTTYTFGHVQPNINSNTSNASSNGNSSSSKSNSTTNVGKRYPVVNTTWMPYNEQMGSSENRCNSFITWPRQIAQKPSEMVTSGFYYTGHGDVVQCFYCGMSLKHWECTDVVDDEHQKYAPECKYITMVRHK